MMFSPGDFFAWEHFAYRDIFEGVEYVWEALTQIDDYLRSHTSSRNEIRGLVHPGAYLVGQHILIEEDAEVEPGAYIHGPCIIGRGCIVRHGAYVRADTLAGENCIIGHASETKNAILLPGSSAAHFAYVGDSILGNRVNLGAGVKLANFRLDGGQITVRANNQKYATGLNKLGAILGDDCQLGCNSVCNPGTLLGPRSVVYALTSVSGYHAAGSILKSPSIA